MGDLTSLEVETLRLLALGHEPKALARRQGVQPMAIHCRVWRASKKLGTGTLASTVMLAYQMGYFTLPRIGGQGWKTR